MIADITKRIRRTVTTLPEGQLTVSIEPNKTIEIGIKGKPKEKLVIDIANAWSDFQNPPCDEASVPLPPPVIDEPEFLVALRTKLNTKSYSTDLKENASIIAKIDGIIASAIAAITAGQA